MSDGPEDDVGSRSHVRVNTTMPKQEMLQQNQGPSSQDDFSQNGSL